MGFTKNTESGSSSFPYAAMIQDPKLFLSALQKNTVEQVSAIVDSFSKKQVRELLANAESKKLDFSYKLFMFLPTKILPTKINRIEWTVNAYAAVFVKFYEKSNRVIKISEFDGLLRNESISTIEFLARYDLWDLLSEFLLKIEEPQNSYGLSLWQIIMQVRMRIQRMPPEDEKVARCKKIAQEFDGESRRITLYHSFHLDPHDPLGNSKRRLELFHAVYSGDFLCGKRIGTTRGNDHKAVDILCERAVRALYPPVEIENEINAAERPLHARVSKIIEWELFISAKNLIGNLPRTVAASVIASLSKEARDALLEFPENSADLRKVIYKQIKKLEPNDFDTFLNKAQSDDMLRLNLTHDEERSLYLAHHESIDKSDYCQEFIDHLVKNEMQENLGKTTGISTPEILLQKIIDTLVNHPESFAPVLNSNLVLADKYFDKMDDPQLTTLLMNSETHYIDLTEQIIQLFAFGVVNDINLSLGMPYINLSDEELLVKKEEMKDCPSLRRSADQIDYEAVAYDKSYLKNIIVVSIYSNTINFTKAYNHYIRDKFLRNTTLKMLQRIFQLNVVKKLEWNEKVKSISPIFICLFLRSEIPIIQKIMSMTAPSLFNSYFDLPDFSAGYVLKNFDKYLEKIELALEWLYNHPEPQEWISKLLTFDRLNPLNIISQKHAVALYLIIKDHYAFASLTEFYVLMKPITDANPKLGHDLLERFQNNVPRQEIILPSAPELPFFNDQPPTPVYQPEKDQETERMMELEFENKSLRNSLAQFKEKNLIEKVQPQQDNSVHHKLDEISTSLAFINQAIQTQQARTLDPLDSNSSELARLREQNKKLSLVTCAFMENFKNLHEQLEEKNKIIAKHDHYVANLLKFSGKKEDTSKKPILKARERRTSLP